MKKLLHLPVLAVIILFSCKKSSVDEEYYTVTGIVLDKNAKTPIPAAKVFTGNSVYSLKDSAITDVNGKVFFRLKKDIGFVFLRPVKDNYLQPFTVFRYEPLRSNRTDTIYLGMPSYVNITMHKTGFYLPLDSIALSVQGHYADGVYRDMFTVLTRDKADAPDKIFNLNTFYSLPVPDTNSPNSIGSPNVTKLYFHWHIIRSGNIIDPGPIQRI